MTLFHPSYDCIVFHCTYTYIAPSDFGFLLLMRCDSLYRPVFTVLREAICLVILILRQNKENLLIFNLSSFPYSEDGNDNFPSLYQIRNRKPIAFLTPVKFHMFQLVVFSLWPPESGNHSTELKLL